MIRHLEKERGQEIVKLLRGVIKKKTTDKISRQEERLAGTGEEVGGEKGGDLGGVTLCSPSRRR